MRRQKLLAMLAGLAVVVGAGMVLQWPTRPNRITQENCDRIKEGMSRAEVEAILGPPGDYRTRPTVQRTCSTVVLEVTFTWAKSERWSSNSGQVVVQYDASGRVGRVLYCDLEREEEGFLESLLWRAKRQWHRWFPE